MNEVWIHYVGENAGEVCDSLSISQELPGIGYCEEHDRQVRRVTLSPDAYRPNAYPEGTTRNDMLPADALNECYTQWHDGVANLNLAEVMKHVGRLLGRE